MSEQGKSTKDLFNEYTKNKLVDLADTSLRAGISLIPAVSQFFNDYVKSPSERRLELFLNAVVQDIEKLKENRSDQIDLDDPQFSTFLIHSLQIASRNHQKEKLDALKNAVLNSALLNLLEEDKQTMFLNWIDELTPSHLKALDIIHNLSKYAEDEILPYLNNHLEYIKKTKGDNCDIEYKVPILGDLSKNHDFYHQIIKDLENKGLVDFDDLRTKITSSENIPFSINGKSISHFADRSELGKIDYIQSLHKSVYEAGICTIYTPPPASIESRVTAIGKLFLEFIHSPLE